MDKIVVFSRTLKKAESKNTTIVNGPLKEEILKLKQEPGNGNILIGGVDLPSQLMGLGLIDEFHFVIHPTIVGEGRRIAEGMTLMLKPKLINTTTIPGGFVDLHYLNV